MDLVLVAAWAAVPVVQAVAVAADVVVAGTVAVVVAGAVAVAAADGPTLKVPAAVSVVPLPEYMVAVTVLFLVFLLLPALMVEVVLLSVVPLAAVEVHALLSTGKLCNRTVVDGEWKLYVLKVWLGNWLHNLWHSLPWHARTHIY